MATTCDPEDIGYMLLIATYVFFAPTIITTALRVWVRARDKALGGDDYTIIVSCLLSIALGAVNIAGVASGKGQHACALEKSAIIEISKLSWINQVILFITLCLIKISICLLLLRIKTTKHFSWFIYVIIGLMSLTTLEAIIALAVECNPVNAFWDRSAGKCRSPNLRIYSIYVQASFSVFTDLLCSLLPVVILWKIQLPTRKKVGICVLMGLGLVATAFAALRASSLGLNISDTTYAYTPTGTWMTIEVNLGIIAANLAPLRGLISYFRRRKDALSNAYGSHSGVHHSRNADRSQLGANAERGVERHTLHRLGSSGSGTSEVPLKRLGVTEAQVGGPRRDSDSWDGVDAAYLGRGSGVR